MTGRLLDKVALIFGAGCVAEEWGNGNATAVTYAREGATIVSVDVSAQAAKRTADLVRKEGGTAIDVVADVSSEDQVREAVEKALKEYGRIDILHNNVGTNAQGGPVESSEEDWDRVMTVNVKSLFWTTKYVIPVMEKQGGGSIVNISSIASIAWTGHPMLAYHASKAAVNQFTRSVAVQYASKNIRCNAVLPGLIDTPRIRITVLPFYNGDVEKMRTARSTSVPMRRMGSPWDIANAALFFASDESRYVTGVLMPVDGGLTCSVPH